MTDAEKRSLKCYLTECLEPRLQDAEESMAEYEQAKLAAKDSYAADNAEDMRRYFKAQSSAYQHAIDDFKELFEEDLKEGE